MIADATTVLRAPEVADEAVLTAIRNDLATQQMLLARPRPNSPSRVREWVSRLASDPSSVLFVIAEAESGSAIGFLQITEMDLVNGCGRLGIAVHPDHARRGHGRAAIAMVGPYLHQVFGVRKLILEVRADNQAALSLYRSLGYREVGVWRAHYRQGDTFHDVVAMEAFLGP